MVTWVVDERMIRKEDVWEMMQKSRGGYVCEKYVG